MTGLALNRITDEITGCEVNIQFKTRTEQRKNARNADLNSKLIVVDRAQHLCGALTFSVSRVRVSGSQVNHAESSGTLSNSHGC